MTDAILVLNAGSSSLKFSVFRDTEPLEPVVRGQVEGLFSHPRFAAYDAQGRKIGEKQWENDANLGHSGAIEFLFDWGRAGPLGDLRVVAAGHRIVHGGVKYVHPVRIDPQALSFLNSLVPLAPLHQPHNLAAVQAVARQARTCPRWVASTRPSTALNLPCPRVSPSRGDSRKRACSGTASTAFLTSTSPRCSPRLMPLQQPVERWSPIGNGASMCAMNGCRSVATTMGFTALDGLPMGTRCGAIDPGVLLYLMVQHKLQAGDLEKLLYHESGLLGVSGISGDMRVLLASSDPRAAEAIDLFVYRIGRELGSLAAAMGGLDALVFTGGIGENATAIRATVCREARWLGLELDDAANANGGPRISRLGSRISAWVVPTNEELMIATHTRRLLGA